MRLPKWQDSSVGKRPDPETQNAEWVHKSGWQDGQLHLLNFLGMNDD